MPNLCPNAFDRKPNLCPNACSIRSANLAKTIFDVNHDLPSSNCDLPVGPPGGGGGGRAKILARPAAAEACFNTLSSCPRPPGWPAQAKNDCKDYAIFRHILQVVGTVSLQVPAQHMFSCYLADATWHMVQHHFVLFRAAIIDGHFLCLCASRCNA